jgi:hypothetical protein
MLTMSHRRLQRAVEALVDGELLQDPLRRAVFAHLDECWDCSSEAEVLRLIKHALRRRRATADLAAVRLRRFAASLDARLP